jgi:hypothetical protein
MRSFRTLMVTLACVALVASQLAGMHMHANEHGYVGAPQGTHLHGAAAHRDGHDGTHHSHHGDSTAPSQDHDGDRDVAGVELGSGVSKVLIFIVWLAAGLVILLAPGRRIFPHFDPPLLYGRRVRWRPPMRGPPAVLPAFA